MDKKVVIFARVSTSNQEYDRQVNGKYALALRKKLVGQKQTQKEQNCYVWLNTLQIMQ